MFVRVYVRRENSFHDDILCGYLERGKGGGGGG